MTRSLWLKLMGAFAVVIAAGTGLVVLLTGRATAGQFELYVTRSGQILARQLAPALGDYYSRAGTWDGVDRLLGSPATNAGWAQDGDGWMGGMWDGMEMMGGMGEGWTEAGMGMEMWGLFGNRLILADARGLVVADTGGTLLGQRLPPDDLARGTTVLAGSQPVGTLLATSWDAPATPAGDFLRAVQRSVLWSGLAAGGLALVLGSALFYQITRPLQTLAAAARGIARGDLGQRARPGARDEVGQVALTFNQMADSLQRYALERRHMVADIAHELRTPLSVIQGNLEAMLDGVLPASAEELAGLHQEALLLNRLIGDLRTLSLAEAGQLQLEKQRVDPGALVEQVVDRLRLRAEEKQASLQAEVAGGLPAIEVDPERLVQALTNLVDNALRYTPAGTHVAVTAKATPGAVELAVSDDGPGIPPEDLPHVFDRFWRAERSRNRATGGSGLGLAIVKQLVEAHGGRVRVESPAAHADGRASGARFVLRLPVQPSELRPQRPA